jgi:hypothetical protein
LLEERPFGPREEARPDGVSFRLEHEDGTPADPPSFRTTVLSWRAGDLIPLGHRTLRVVDVRDDDAGRCLVVEDADSKAH